MKHVDVCAVDDVPPGKSRAVCANGRDIALFNVDGTVYAIENSCLHQGAALSGGQLCGRQVTCRAHGWRFDVTTGRLGNSTKLGVITFPVNISGDRVLVAIAN
jgi:nitrite reductase/ring-hydroxylating ferredoxin subunit